MPSGAPDRDIAVPAPGLLFPIVDDVFGPRLALVFGNEAPGGVCPFARAALCHHCDIGLGEGARFDAAANRRRLAWFRAAYERDLARVAHLVLYDSGSVLNPAELSAEFLDELLDFTRGLPALRAVSLDTRETYVRAARVADLARRLGAPREIRAIVGLESADDRIRDHLLEKRMPRAAIERAADDLAAAARASSREGGARVGLDVNVVAGGPGAAGERAIDDARETARYAIALATPRDLPLGLNLHPYYPSARALARFPDHPRPALATVVAAARAVLAEVRAARAEAALFLGLHDEGHDRRPAERAGAVDPLRAALARFHRTQDAAALDVIDRS